MNNTKIEVGKRIAEARKEKNIKQEELKELIGAPTVQMISSWENGHSFPSVTYLINISKKLDISLDYLLLGEDKKIDNYEITTYKKAIKYVMGLIECGLFDISGYNTANHKYRVILETMDDTIAKYYHEANSLFVASSTMRRELFQQALIELIDKYDFSLNLRNKK